MKYVWLIAFLLLILVGFEAAANFVAAVLIGSMIFLLVAAVYMAITELVKLKLWSALKWAIAAGFFGWLLSICF